ncbi:MAG: ABC transporter substrate-binding protein [Candidatus Dormibacteraeota bacterium]|nr:ABC transporter substrate-binding protein [Candidatus Dormibacteraeota bacterium]
MAIEDLMQQRVSRRWVVKAGAAGTLFLLTGCTSAANSGAGTSSGPKKGGTLHMAQVPDIIPSGLFGQNFPNTAVGRLVYNTLTEYDHKTLKPNPSLATSWQLAGDGTSLTLELRKDVKFHSGRPFGPDDVIFSIQNIQDPKRASQLRSTAAVITDASGSGSTVKLRLSHAASNLFDLFEIMFIVDKDTLPDMLSGKNLNGTGPFVWKQWNPGDSVALSKNPNYWKSGRPYLDGVELRIIPQAQSLLSSLQAQQTELALGLAPKDYVGLKNNPAFTTQVADTGDAAYYVGCNVKVPPFDRKEVRQAVAYAVDKERILKEVFSGVGNVTSIPWPKSSPAYTDAAATHYSYNPNKAKQILQSAGLTNVQAQLAFNSGSPPLSPMAQIVQFNLQQIGITTQTVSYDAAQFIQKLQAGTLPGLWVNVHGFSQLHPATLIVSAFPFNAAKNASNLNDPVYVDLANQAFRASEGSAKAVYQKVTDYLLDQQFVIDSVISPGTFVSVNKFKNFTYNMFDYLDFDEAYLA